MNQVDLGSIKQQIPEGTTLPPLLEDFAKWVEKIPQGAIGYFESMSGGPWEMGGLSRDELDRINKHICPFIKIGDGTEIALWWYDVAKAPAVVLLAGDGPSSLLADTLNGFLLDWSRKGTGVVDLDVFDDEEEDSIPERYADLAAFLASRGAEHAHPSRVPDFTVWLVRKGELVWEKSKPSPKHTDGRKENSLRHDNLGRWITLMGRLATDPELTAALESHGGTVPIPKIRPSDSWPVKLSGYAVVFGPGDWDSPTASIGAFFQLSVNGLTYEGPLPYGLARGATQEQARDQLGSPAREDDFMPWDEWDIDGRILRLQYDDDDESNIFVESIYIMMPEGWRPDASGT